tara:strand:+ start:1021 stop:1338 length:318 start_codon:yes stop_codon:yes gene_type:complete
MDISNAKVTNMYGMNNIIKEVKFSLTGTDGVNTVTNFFPVKLDYPEAGDFIEYEELTRDQIFQWVINNVEENLINNLKTGITSQLRDKQIVDPDNPVLNKIKLPS